MRRAYDGKFAVVDDGNVAGVSLGADFTSEHEWGIKPIYQRFAVDRNKDGVEGRTIHAGKVYWFEHKGVAGFTSKGVDWDDKPLKPEVALSAAEVIMPITTKNKTYSDKLQTAWDDSNFAAFSADKTDQEHLKKIFEAFGRLDITICLGGGGVFQNPGILIGIRSLLPKSVTDLWMEKDLEHKMIEKKVVDTGIREKLAKAGKKYYALSPRYDKEKDSLIFWLNPQEQDQNNYGWMTIQDLEDWIAGTGRIPKQEAKHGKAVVR